MNQYPRCLHILLALALATTAVATEEDRAVGSLPYLANAASLVVEATGLTEIGTTDNGTLLVRAEVREVLKGDFPFAEVAFLVSSDLGDESSRPVILFLDENYAKTFGGRESQPDYVLVSGRSGLVDTHDSPDRLPAIRGYLAAQTEPRDKVLQWSVENTNSPDPLLSVASFYELARLLPVYDEEANLFSAYWSVSDPPRRRELEEVAALPPDRPVWHRRYLNPWGTDLVDRSTSELSDLLMSEDVAVAEQFGALNFLASRTDTLSRDAMRMLITKDVLPFEVRKAALISIARQSREKWGDVLLEIQRDLSPMDPLLPYLDVLEP